MLKATTFLSLVIFAAVKSVYGHGYVQEIVSGSTMYTGYLPYQDPYMDPAPRRIVRKIPSNGPVSDPSLIDIQCNGWTEGGVIGSAPAPLYATFSAGSRVSLNWTTWPESHVGPVITYMARAPSDVTKWNPGSDPVWFKVDESGKTADRKWAATDLLTSSNSVYTLRIPPKLKPGQYIIRHEIIALHGAFEYPGAQIYPSCIQVEVIGTGTAFPTAFVSFPGAYTKNTPGILFDVYTDQSLPYPIPGPPV
ncbi:unnamed protein product [Cyclocybe aegerita]|uniref:lytic cellulose monooxygenase (C4-dehydrogenating) n=1 Tax=Cyclocybe aegerita TaxID=1973307 RepID=A0A8S0VT18_CYCAE|nr:unnamed protein product [Cyclocybe aegerita]